MKMPWCKLYADFYYCPKAQSMSEAMQRRFIMLLCLRCDGELEKLGDDEVRTALRISLKQWLKTKVLFITKGFMDQHLNLLNWEKRQSQYGTATRYLAEKGAPKSGAQRAAEYRARKGQKAQTATDVTDVTDVTDGVTDVTDGVTDVTDGVTDVTDGVTDVTQSVTSVTDGVTGTVTRPENLPENSIKIQQVTTCNETPLDIDIDIDLDVDKDLRNLEATSKSIAPPVGAAPPSTGGRTYTAEFVLPPERTANSNGNSAATSQATAALGPVDPRDLPMDDPADWMDDPRGHLAKTRAALRAGKVPGMKTLPAAPNRPAAHKTESLANPDSPLEPFTAPLAHENGGDKGILHADLNGAKKEPIQTVSKKPAKPAPSVVQAEVVDEGRKSRKKELTQEQRNLNATIWQRYQAAYVERYGANADPVRNEKVNSQLNELRKRLGREAPDVAAFYVGINDNWLIRTGHTVGNLLQGCEGYRTQWITGRQVNSVTARHMENTQANIETVKQVTQKMASSNYVNPLDRLMAIGLAQEKAKEQAKLLEKRA